MCLHEQAMPGMLQLEASDHGKSSHKAAPTDSQSYSNE